MSKHLRASATESSFVVRADPEAAALTDRLYHEHRRRIEVESAKLLAPRLSKLEVVSSTHRFERVIRAGYTFRGEVHAPVPTEFEVCVQPGHSITIRKDGDDLQQTFRLGDQASYDSWNRIYHGDILAITPKTVRISKSHGERKAVLNTETFCSRNYGFDERKAYKRNHAW